MKILVFVKGTPDTDAKIVLTEDSKAVDTSQLKFIINPYDEYALEEAMKLKDKDASNEVVIVFVGKLAHKEVVTKSLAFGADRAFLVDTTENQKDPNSDTVSQALSKIYEKEKPQVVLCGRHAIDDDNMHVPAMVAERAKVPFVNIAAKIDWKEDSVRVERTVDGGMTEISQFPLPAIIGCDKTLNSPRFPSLPNIMKAKKKPVETLSFSELVTEAEQNKADFELEGFSYPAEKGDPVIFKDEPVEKMAEQLIQKLRDEAKVLD